MFDPHNDLHRVGSLDELRTHYRHPHAGTRGKERPALDAASATVAERCRFATIGTFDVLGNAETGADRHGAVSAEAGKHDAIGTGLGAAVSSFLFFATGAIIPVLPYLFGVEGMAAVITAAVLVGIALLATGVVVGLLSGAPPLRRALRQLVIGYGAAAITWVLGLLVGA